MKVAIAQLNPVLCGLKQNTDAVIQVILEAHKRGVDAVLLPAMALSGAPLQGMAGRPDYQAAQDAAFNRVIRAIPKGMTVSTAHNVHGRFTYQTWGESDQTPESTDVLLIPNCERFSIGGHAMMVAGLKHLAKGSGVTVLRSNLVGGQDRCVFDGGAVAVMPDGQVLEGPRFEVGVMDVEMDAHGKFRPPAKAPHKWTQEEELWATLTLGTRDYVEKNGFPGVLVAVSGGVDSALVAAIAVDALGPKRVLAVTMPSAHSTKETHADAHLLAKNLGIDCLDIPIPPGVDALADMLAAQGAFSKTFPIAKDSKVEENLQARIRGVLAMSLSNRYGLMLLETSNRSESLMGYCTLYGDTCGGFAPISRLYKTDVFTLARWRNKIRPVIPPSIIKREPSAELRPGQKDTDTLPPYDELDKYLRIFEFDGMPSIKKAGLSVALAKKLYGTVAVTEFKRQQSPMGIFIAPGNPPPFPITNAFRG